jgi:hypothetical protein
MPRKALGAKIDALAQSDSAMGKSTIEAGDATERGIPTDGVNPARSNKIVEDVHVAEGTMRPERM